MATLLDKMLLKKEEWIDISLMATSTCCRDGKVVIYYQYNKKHPYIDEHTTTLLRKCLRAVGHKIIKWESVIDEDYSPVQTSYYTSITQEEGELMTKLHNEYVSETYEDL